MKLYLSSYKFGDEPEKFTGLFSINKKVGLISNALDFSTNVDRLKLSIQAEVGGLINLGLQPTLIDLRNFFNRNIDLEKEISTLGGLWVRGGNTFVLAAAYKLSELDRLIKEKLIHSEDFVYGGYSAGVCVLQKDLKGIDFVDDPNQTQLAYGDNVDTVWEGVSILDYRFVPHYKSDHPESEDTDKEVEYYKKNGIEFKTLRDGEVLIEHKS